MAILEEKGSWLRVRLEDGAEAWIWKASTAEGPKSTPQPQQQQKKPSAM